MATGWMVPAVLVERPGVMKLLLLADLLESVKRREKSGSM